MTGTEAFELATRKARFGHRDWIVWQERDGSYRAEARAPAAVKRALLANGTKGRAWWVVGASTSSASRGFWKMGLIMLRNAKVGC
ncbi:MAG TPA: hypothetical protein VD970_18055 [Acetobacteraceae bacterium]|nr:hypothetical protein [Acetobacteraceae bacterium]